MLRPRIIPCLLIQNGGLVKTVQFKPGKYVGDPLNAVRIFNEKMVDELVVLDIDASRHRRPIDYRLIANLAAECRMPLCYGGGVASVEDALRLIGLGVEKVAISSAALRDPLLITRIAEAVGRQSVVVVVDLLRRKKLFGNAIEMRIANGTEAVPGDPFTFIAGLEELGAGEVVINAIDRDGMMQGYDLDLAERARACTSLPLTILGGAGSLDDIAGLIAHFGIIGSAAGSAFVFKGKYRAVLITYPTAGEKATLVAQARLAGSD